MKEKGAESTKHPHLESDELQASIIIVNYNAGQKLLDCLSSISSTSPAPYEVLVVDNASTDGVAELVERDFPHFKVIRAVTNLGFGGGCNLGANSATGRYLVFLNPDTTVDPGWLRSLLEPLSGENDIGLSTSRILLARQPDRINACGNSVHITGTALCVGLGRQRDEFGAPGEVAAVSGAAFAIRRNLFESLNGFDETMFLYVEDTDLSLRSRLAGWRCWYVPESVVWHDYSLKITSRKVFFQERNRYLMLIKVLKWRTLLVLFPALILGEVMSWGFVLLRDRSNFKNKISAYSWILKNWREITTAKKETQSLRRVPDRELLRQMDFRIDFDQLGTGAAINIARNVFNPIFFLLRTFVMALIWW